MCCLYTSFGLAAASRPTPTVASAQQAPTWST